MRRIRATLSDGVLAGIHLYAELARSAFGPLRRRVSATRRLATPPARVALG
ncbi:MAG: hypothetical protein MJE66_23840 [Proteobacteria bacterium]|nr:hypothetical protein [Pseudomonadota bacterium]